MASTSARCRWSDTDLITLECNSLICVAGGVAGGSLRKGVKKKNSGNGSRVSIAYLERFICRNSLTFVKKIKIKPPIFFFIFFFLPFSDPDPQ